MHGVLEDWQGDQCGWSRVMANEQAGSPRVRLWGSCDPERTPGFILSVMGSHGHGRL